MDKNKEKASDHVEMTEHVKANMRNTITKGGQRRAI